jgi:dTDP-4-dehydrorhamnose reductase
MTRTLVLGIDGMLGGSVFRVATRNGLDVYGTSRREIMELNGAVHYYDGSFELLDNLLESVQPDYIINCIGLIKQKMSDSRLGDLENAIQVNTLFPHFLSSRVECSNTHIIQIATDCVFNGIERAYTESSPFTPNDHYGLTKKMGEVSSRNFLNLRTSIVGPENNQGVSLFNWVWKSPQRAVLQGYTNHYWNGITSDAFAEVVVGQIKSSDKLCGTQHLIPRDFLSKYELIQQIAKVTNRDDLEIVPMSAPNQLNRRLSTDFPEQNLKLWKHAGFRALPLISELLSDIHLP